MELYSITGTAGRGGASLDVQERALKNGVSAIETMDLMMLLLRSGVKGRPAAALARQVLEAIFRTNPEDLTEELLKIRGMGPGKTLAIAAALELGRRLNGHLSVQIRGPKDLIPLVQHYAMQPQEHFLSISLNGAHEILQIRVVGVGGLNRTMIQPREIFVDALKERACAIILCHNHPSNSCKPSDEDVETTRQLLEAAGYIGISILDHIIVTKSGYYSFRESHELFQTWGISF